MSNLLATIILITLSGCTVGNPAPQTDPCDSSVYSELNESGRSTEFEIEFSAQTRPRCDIDLSPGWYRFTSEAGGTMPTTCPDQFTCGTIVPMWMKGDNPSVTDGIVTRQACGHYVTGGDQEDRCCEISMEIEVKNCGQYFVYYLSPPPSCPIAYCVSARDGYPPITVAPTLKGPLVPNSRDKFEFQCEITYDISDPEQVFEVIWTFDGVQDPNVPPQELTDPSRTATLDGTKIKNHINSNLDCRVRAFYRGNENEKSDWLISNSYYAGIVVSPTTLIISEKENKEGRFNITSTIPIVCPYECCLRFVLDTDAQKQALFGSKCNYKLCSKDWDQDQSLVTTTVQVVANQDFVTDGNKHQLITFNELKPFGGSYLNVFDGYIPDQVNVVVEDEETFTCLIHGDPHVISFDNQRYDLYLLGDFTAYEVPERHFQIQIRTWACADVTCICGVVIREENDIIRIDQCDQLYGGAHTSPTVSSCHLRNGVEIQRSRDGSTIAVYLLSGAQIKVKAYSTNFHVDIMGPGIDKNKARGLCGTYDGNSNNEFTYPDGTIDQTASNEFYEAWRASRTDSLFQVLPPEVSGDHEFQYCTCNDNDRTVNCSGVANVAQRWLCNGCPDYKPQVQKITQNCLRNIGKRKREAVYEDYDATDDVYDLTSVQATNPTANLNQQWPNVEGITEAQAREMCTRAIEKSQLNGKCGGSGSSVSDAFMEGCLGDILHGGTTEMLDSITSAFTSSCQMDLAKDPANYVTSPKGKQIMKPEYLDDICDLECDKHGSCGEKGVCVCDSGWEGYNCHIQSGIGPQVDRIRGGPLCDLAQRPCQRIFLDVSNVDLSDDLICRVQKVDNQGNNIGQAMDSEANFLSGFRIACALPETTVSSQVYKISASNDGSLFGNQMSVRVFDSTCLDCDETRCREKSTACHIDDVCYRDGAIHVDNPLKVCDVSKDTSQWTDKTVCRGVQIADIIFVIDASGSIGQFNFAQQLSFLSNMTKHFALGPDNVRFGAVVFASSAQKLFDLKDYSDHTSLANAITSTSYTGGTTDTASALNMVADQNMFAVASGGRASATQIVIVITDGQSDSQSQTVAASQRLKDDNVQMMSIGVGDNTREDELEQMASGPENVFEVSGFDVLSHIEEKVTKQTCSPAQNIRDSGTLISI